MAMLQQALEAVQNGKMYVHHYGDGVREFLLRDSYPAWPDYIKHVVIGPDGGGQANFTPDGIRSLPRFTQNGWEPTDIFP